MGEVRVAVPTEIAPDLAAAQAQVLENAAKVSPVLQVRRPLMARAKEWRRAVALANTADGCGNAVAIVLAGGLEAGMVVMTVDGRTHEVVRLLATSLHLSSEDDGREHYMNLRAGGASPVVVVL